MAIATAMRTTTATGSAPGVQAGATGEPAWVRWSLTVVVLAFLVLFLLMPMVAVFYEALQKGVGAYFKSFDDADAWHAIKLTLITAAVAVPANLLFGLAAAWAIAKFEFLGKSVLTTLIDLPFAISPVISGLIYVLMFGLQGFLENWTTRPAALIVVLAIILPVALVFVAMVVTIAVTISVAARAVARRTGAGGAGAERVRRLARVGVLGLVAVVLLGVVLLHPIDLPWHRVAPTSWNWPSPTFSWQGFGDGLWPIGMSVKWKTGVIYAIPGIILATTFVTFPFVARELIPLMQAQGTEEEQAALVLGASGWQTFRRVTLPNIKWGLLYGVILCNARAMGEFGAVSVVSGSIRGETNTMPLHVEILYNEYNSVAAFSIASLLALLAVVTLVLKSIVEWRSGREVQSAE